MTDKDSNSNQEERKMTTLTFPSELAVEQADARYCIRLLSDEPNEQALADKLQHELDIQDTCIRDTVDDAKAVLKMNCACCDTQILPGTGYCSSRCWEEDGGAL